jgi:hypothetical protein
MEFTGKDLVLFLGGGGLGVIASIAAALITRQLRHTLRFGESILRNIETQSGVQRAVYRIRLENVRKRKEKRYVFDLELSAYLYTDPIGDNPHDRAIELPLHVAKLPRLRYHRFLRLEINDRAFNDEVSELLAESGKRRIGQDEEDPLRRILTELSGAWIRVFVSATDSFSGTRHLVETRELKASAIIDEFHQDVSAQAGAR